MKCTEKININGIIECKHRRKIISGLGGCICKKENCYKRNRQSRGQIT